MKCSARSGLYIAAWLFASLAGENANAQSSQTTLSWAVPPFAPAFITDGDELRGYAADTQNWFVEKLPQYQHEILQVPLARLLAEMKNGNSELRCSTTLIPTEERREYITFAKTILLHLPISVVIRVKDKAMFAPYVNQAGHIDLAQLIANKDMTTAIRIGRAYGTQVDKYLDTHREDANVMQVADDTKFLRMLELNRIDWTLYFPSEAEFYRRRHAPDLDVMAIPIAGNTSLLTATIGCADTPEGKQAVAEISKIVDEYPSMPWTDFYADWLSPQDREWFKAAREQFINSDQFEARLQYRQDTPK